MSAPLEAAVTGVGLWLPAFHSAAAWRTGARDATDERPSGSALARTFRRRASVLCRAISDAADEALAQAGVDRSRTPIVVGSSIGEAGTLVGLLEQMWRSRTPMSPAAFTVSVHNSAAGLLSISNAFHGAVTSIAADDDTPAAALFEALGLVHQQGVPVLAVCGDEAVPERVVGGRSTWELMAAAVVLAPCASARAPLARLELTGDAEATLPPAEADVGAANHPQAGMLDLVDAVQRGRAGVLALDRGGGRGFRARLRFDPASGAEEPRT